MEQPKVITLGELAEAWLQAAYLRETTRRHYRYVLRRYVLPTLGKLPLDCITPEQIQALYASLAASTAHHVHRVLHRCLAVAVRWRKLDVNPCDLVERPAHRYKRGRMWTVEQARAFVRAAAGHPLGDLCILLLVSGLRLGEALGLRWQDVGVGVAVTVREAARWAGQQLLLNSPKTESGARTVLLPQVGIEALKRLRAAASDASPDAFIFASVRKADHPVRPETVRRHFKRICTQAGLPDIRLHDLRHLHASMLLAEGVSITEVAQRLGHATPNITLGIYAHALNRQTASAAAMERILKPMNEVNP